MVSTPTFLSIDVLSSGAEFSGTGLFLSLWGKSSYQPSASPGAGRSTRCDYLMETSKLLCRYSLTGCACDVSSRGAADQKFSLSAVQAIFCTTSRLSELANLPGFLYALQRSCSINALSIVSLGPADIVQSLVELLHGRQQYPTVRVCQVPSTASSLKDIPTWWQVYSDVHIMAHVAVFSWSSLSQNEPSGPKDEVPALVYVFTTHADSKLPGNHLSLIYIPETTPDTALPTLVDFFSDKPSCLPTESAAVRWTVCIRSSTSSSIASLPPDWLVFTTNSTSRDDHRLLRRARLQTQALHEQLGKAWAARLFPVRRHQGELDTATMLQTGSSIVFDQLPCAATSATPNQDIPYFVFDRCRSSEMETESSHPTANGDGDNNSAPEHNAIQLDGVQNFCSIVEPIPRTNDENEIDLEDDEDDNDDHNVSIDAAPPYAQLLVLGTGCASPSPLRGASGYAILLAGAPTIVLEAGEGFCTQWNRHAPCSSFSSIQVIWISHAHWDHYGGLVNLLCCILDSAAIDARGSSVNIGGPKRRRVEQLPPPYVVAPSKVLRYLEFMLDGSGGGGKYYRGVHPKASRRLSDMCDELNHNSADGNRRIALWDAVKVDHGCEAYGLVLGLHKSVARVDSNNPATFLFAFSGDTRPSTDFVRCCNLASRRQGCSSHVDFMVHEATFDEREAQMSVTKKHSTIKEALDVASRAKTLRLALTHFSQRYRRGCEVQDAPCDRSYPTQTLFSVDGMAIPLF